MSTAKAPLFEVLQHGLTDGVDHDLLVEQAARHGLSAWVAEDLSKARVTLQAEAQAKLTRNARVTVAHALKNRRLTHAVLDALGKVGVTPILLKGYGLASRLYPEPLARPATDVDVLVAPHELATVKVALATLGLAEVPDEALADVFEEHHHVQFGGPAGLVEVHFRLFVGFGGATFDEAQLRANATKATLDGRAVRFLGPEDEFVYLATHAANHAFLRASWLLDLKLFMAKVPLDWAQVAWRARAVGFGPAVSSALVALEQALGVDASKARASLPGSWLRRALDPQLFSAERLAQARVAEGRVSSFVVRLWLVDGSARRARHLLEGAQRFARRSRAQGGAGR